MIPKDHGKVIRVNSWKEFRHLLIKHNVKEIAYSIEMEIPAIFNSLKTYLTYWQYSIVFVDTASGKTKKDGYTAK